MCLSFSHIWLFATLWTGDCQAPLSKEFTWQENPGVCCHSLLLGIFPTQGSNPGLLHCRQILYCLGHQGIEQFANFGFRKSWETWKLKLSSLSLSVCPSHIPSLLPSLTHSFFPSLSLSVSLSLSPVTTAKSVHFSQKVRWGLCSHQLSHPQLSGSS